MASMMAVGQLILMASFLLHVGGAHAQITSAYDNSTLFTTMGFDGGGLFLSQFDCPSTYLCRNPLETKSKVLPKWDALNCQCDDACAVYGDCCVNAKFYGAEPTKKARELWRCISLVQYQGLYMLTKCPASWSEADTREKCEKGGVLEDGNITVVDPLSMTPVTSLVTRFTYQNIYCAYCSGDVERIVYWIPRVECNDFDSYNTTFNNITNEFVWSQLKYNNRTAQWGIYLKDTNASYDQSNDRPKRPSAPPPTAPDSDPNFVTCRLMVQMPINVVDLVRQCKPWIDDCPSGTNSTVRDLCHSYTAVAFGKGLPDKSYRNVHCAMCNGEDLSSLSCNGLILYRNVDPKNFAPSFAFLFDINENSGMVVGTVQRCQTKGEIYDPFFKICRQMVCINSDYKVRNGRCVLREVEETATTTEVPKTTPKSKTTTTKEPKISVKTTTETEGVTDDYDNNEVTQPGGRNALNESVTSVDINETDVATNESVDEQLNCPRFNISRLHYHIYNNGSIFIDEYERHYGPHEYVAAEDGSILICMPLNTDDLDHFYKRKFSVVFAYLTLACLGISLVCLVFHLIVFTQVPSLHNLSGKNLASLCVALITAYVTFIISQFQDSVSSEVCTSVGVIMYYSFLASFFWMNCISYDVWMTLRLATRELRLSDGKKWGKFVLCSAYSWFGSALVVVAAIVVENSDNVSRIYKPSFGLVSCWFGSRRALMVFFVTPVILIVVVNILLFALSAHIIVSTTRNSAILHPSSKARRNFWLYLRLALMMGLTWIFGIVAGQIDREPVWYVFVILNALQGLFIFVSFTCTRKVRLHLRNRLLCSVGHGDYYSSSNRGGGRHPKKFELEGRDSGSGESQSSQTSHLSLSKTASKASTDTLY